MSRPDQGGFGALQVAGDVARIHQDAAQVRQAALDVEDARQRVRGGVGEHFVLQVVDQVVDSGRAPAGSESMRASAMR